MILLDNFIQRMKKAKCFVLSYFTKSPVYFGVGFTTTDESLTRDQMKTLERVKNEACERQAKKRKPGVIQYRMNEDACFELVGFPILHGKAVARLRDKSTGEERNVDMSFFNLYFKSI